MEFAAFFNKYMTVSKFDGFNAENFLVSFKEQCESEEDFVQLYELKNIFEVIDLFGELHRAYMQWRNQGASDNFDPIFDKIEALSNTLEDNGISCYSYSYYIYVYLSFIASKDSNLSSSNNLDAMKWNNPKYFNYANKLYEKTFGLMGKSKTKAFPDDKNFVVEKGILVEYKGRKPYVIVPDYVKKIARTAFEGNKKIKMIYLPDTVTSIEEGAFKYCSKLNLVHLSNKIHVIPNYCFDGCKNLKIVNAEEIRSVGDYGFNLCSLLKNIELDSITSVGDYAFSLCLSLDKFDFVANLTSIGDYAFQGTKIESLFLGDCSYLGDHAFAACQTLKEITFNSPVHDIGSIPFCGCYEISKIIINKNFLGRIMSLFETNEDSYSNGGYKLERIKIGELTPEVFSGLSNLGYVQITGYGREIPSEAFKNCFNLKRVVFNNKEIDVIDDGAFENCEALTELDIYFNGNEIGNSAFYKCGNIADFSFLNEVTKFGAKSLAYTNLTNFDFKNRSFEFIGEFAFANSYFPETLNIILQDAIVLPGAFHGANLVNAIKVKNINLSGDQFHLLFERSKEDFNQKVEIKRLMSDFIAGPGMFEGCSAKYIECNLEDGNIPEALFKNCQKLESVKLNGLIEHFGDSCFENCFLLELINSDFDNYLSIGNSSFKNCKAYKYEMFESTAFIGNYAFQGCNLIDSLQLDEKIEYIGIGAFAKCPIKGKLILPFVGNKPNDVNGVFGSIFSNVPAKDTSLQSISNDVNYYIPNLIDDIEITSNRIGKDAFKNCDFIKRLELPNVTGVEGMPFSNCGSLEEIVFGEKLKEFDPIAIAGTSKNLRITIAEQNPYLLEDCGSIYSKNKEELYYGKFDNGFIPTNVRVIKTHALMSIACPELHLENLDLIEKYAINLSHINNVSIKDVMIVENHALYGCKSLDKLVLESSESVTITNLFDSVESKHINEVSITNVEIDSLSNLFNKEELHIDTIKVEETSIKDSFFEIAYVKTIKFIGVHGNSYLPYDAQSVEMTDSDPFSKLLVNDKSLTLNNVIIDKDNLVSGEFKSLNATNLAIYTDGKICDGAFDEAFVRNITIDGVSEIESSVFKGFDFENIEILNSPYKTEDNCIFKDDSLFFFKPTKKMVNIPTSISKISEFSVDLSRVETLVIDREDLRIEDKSFYNCLKLEKVSTTAIKCSSLSNVFENSSSIERIDYNSDVVGRKFLSGFANVDTIVLPNTIKTVKDFGLANNPKLTKIANFNLICNYGDFVLANCESLSKIEFNPLANLIGIGCVEDCKSLSVISYPITENHQYGLTNYKDVIGENNNATIKISSGNIPDEYFKGCKNDIIIESNPKTVGNKAFYGCPSFKIDLARATKIGDYAFAGTQIQKPNIKSCLEIGAHAFANCQNVKEIVLNQNLDLIGEGAFEECPISSVSMTGSGVKYNAVDDMIIEGSNLIYYAPFAKGENFTAAKYGIKRILPFVFSKTKYLKHVVCSGVNEICAKAFDNCQSIETLDIPNKKCVINKGVLSQCAIQSLRIFGITSDNIQKLSDIFANSAVPSTLQSLAISGDKLVAGELNCPNGIKAITLNDEIKEIPNKYFEGNKTLQSLTLPKNCESIGAEAFASCDHLQSIQINTKCKSIGDNAFSGCTSLADLTIPASVEKLGSTIIKGCNNLYRLTLHNKFDSFKLSDLGLSNTSRIANVSIDNVKKLSIGAFEGYRALKEVNIPSEITNIPDNCFLGCSSLSNYTFPDKCENIGKNAFVLSGLTQFRAPRLLKVIQNNAFSNASKLTAVDLMNSSISKIGIQAFSNTGVTQIKIPETVIELGDSSFLNCNANYIEMNNSLKNFKATILGTKVENLKEVFLKIVSFAPNAFAGCSNLEKVTIQKVEENKLPDSLFENHTSLKKLILGDNVKEVGNRTFAGCANLEFDSKFIGNLEKIGVGSFTGCSKIINLNLSSVADIGDGAFESCGSLRSATFSNSLLSIPKRCFAGCRKLSDVNLPLNIERIEEQAFAYTAIKKIDIPNSVKYVGSMVFKDNKKGAKVTIPKGYDTSKWAPDWAEELSQKHKILKFLNPKIKVKERR